VLTVYHGPKKQLGASTSGVKSQKNEIKINGITPMVYLIVTGYHFSTQT
jgi:hypothetical protein